GRRVGGAPRGVGMGARQTLIYLLRHGEVVLAETRRFIGHLDVPLSAHGERQSRAQAARLAGARLAAVFTSDLERARRTAEIIASPHGLTPTMIPALREMAMGRWDGRTAEEIRRSEPAAFADWMARVGEVPFPEGESVPDLRARAWPAFVAIVAAHAGESIAIVAHGGTNRALLCTALGLELHRILALGQDYGALSVLERVAEGWRLGRPGSGRCGRVRGAAPGRLRALDPPRPRSPRGQGRLASRPHGRALRQSQRDLPRQGRYDAHRRRVGRVPRRQRRSRRRMRAG